MDLSSLIKRPRIEYKPQRVELPNPDIPEPVVGAYANRENDLADTLAYARAEIQALSDLQDAIVSVIPVTSVTVPDELVGLVGKNEVTLSDYLESLAGEDYGPVAIRETYESHAAGEAGEPAVLMVPLVDTMRRSLSSAFENLSDDLYRGEFPPTAVTDATLWSIRCDVDDCKRFREEVEKACRGARAAIDKALWAGVIDASDIEGMRGRGEEIIATLRRMRSLLTIAGTLYATDWKSATATVRDHFYSALIDTQMNIVLRTYHKAYSKVVSPVRRVISKLTGRRITREVKELDNVVKLVTRATDHVAERFEDVIADIYAIRRKRSEFAISGVRAVGVLAYTKRLQAQLDVIIAAVSSLTEGQFGFNLTAEALYGPLAKVLDDKRIFRISETDVGFVVDEEMVASVRKCVPPQVDPLESKEVSF